MTGATRVASMPMAGAIARSLRTLPSIWIAYGLAMALFMATAIISPGFAHLGPVGTLAAEASFLGIAGLGQTFVIIGGGVDLSISGMISAAAVLSASLSHGHNASLEWVVPFLLGLGLVVGLINGAGVAIGVSPIIMTLGTQGVIFGGLLLYTKGQAGYSPPNDLLWLGTHKWGPIPVVVVLWIVLGLIGGFVLRRTIYGRHLYSIGAEATVARFSGVNLPFIQIAAYVVSALCAVLSGLAVGGYVAQTYLNVGDPYLFTSVAAVVLGGASILGGSGLYLGTVAGAAILTLLTNLLDILNLQEGWLEMIYGGVILATVIVATRRSVTIRM